MKSYHFVPASHPLTPLPDVAGIAAAIRSSNPTWNATQVRDAIVNSAAAIPQGLFLATVDDINCSSLPSTPPSNSPTTTTAPRKIRNFIQDN